MRILGNLAALVFVAGVPFAGCGASGSGGMLTIVDIGWTESEAIPNLAKISLEEER